MTINFLFSWHSERYCRCDLSEFSTLLEVSVCQSGSRLKLKSFYVTSKCLYFTALPFVLKRVQDVGDRHKHDLAILSFFSLGFWYIIDSEY